MAFAKFAADFSIRAKTICAFAIIIVLMIVADGLIYGRISFIQDSSTWVSHTVTVVDEVGVAEGAVVNQETGVRGYLLSGDQTFLEPFRAGEAAAVAALRNLKTLTVDNPAQQSRLDQLATLIGIWHATVADREIALMGEPSTQAEARHIEISGAGKQSMDGIRAALAEVAAAEQSLLASRTAATNEAFASTYLYLWVGAVVAAVAACLVAYALIRMIAGPVGAMTAAMRRLAQRDLTTTIPSLGRGDEIGSMAAAVQVFKENMVTVDRLAADQSAERALTEARAERLNQLVGTFEGQVGRLVTTLGATARELEATAQSMSSTADQTNAQASTVAGAAAEASMGVQTVAAAAEQLAASIAEITRQVTDSAGMTVEAAQEARRTDGLVRTLSEGATRIGNVVALISGIAGQTNLLALNATIEAARAGEAGKGFAVVASEVKDLASQTAKATSEISAQIGHLQAAVQEAVSAIQGIVERVERISGISTSIASAVEQQGAATAEISRNVQRAASSTQQVTSTITGVSQAANETGTTAMQVLGMAGGLSKKAKHLTDEVSGFVSGVRAA